MSLMDSTTLATHLHPETGIPSRLPITPPTGMKDKFGRTITDLRVSITDRCNYKCVYCRTGTEGRPVCRTGHEGLPAHDPDLRRPRDSESDG